jgi:two-component system cell cycle response regulator
MMEGNPERGSSFRELTREEELDGEVGLLQWELEEQRRRHLEETGVDELTGLRNRAYFKETLAKFLNPVAGNRSGEKGTPRECALLYLDLDNFKQVNDTRGHDAGDEVLRRVAGLMQGAVRSGDVVARLGGDEFVIFLPRAGEAVARTAGDKILKQLGEDEFLRSLGIGMSIGVSVSGGVDNATPEELVKRADGAMYTSKKGGKNRLTVASSSQ